MVKTKNAQLMLESTLKTLDYALKLAEQKEDIDAVMAVTDRLLALFQYITETDQGRKVKMGFHLSPSESEEEEDLNV
jgi:hypothetical protein